MLQITIRKARLTLPDYPGAEDVEVVVTPVHSRKGNHPAQTAAVVALRVALDAVEDALRVHRKGCRCDLCRDLGWLRHSLEVGESLVHAALRPVWSPEDWRQLRRDLAAR